MTIHSTHRSLSTSLLAALILASLVGACTPNLYAITPAPPTRVAELSSNEPVLARRQYFARVSAGVALAFNCSTSVPCKRATATSDDPSIARVSRGHLDQLESDAMAGRAGDHSPPTTFVLVGVQPGQTWVRIRSASGNTKIRVTVIEGRRASRSQTMASPVGAAAH